MVSEIGDGCIPNINAAERRKRLVLGVLMFVVGLGVLVALVLLEVNLWWRLLLFPLFMSAASGFFQWRDKT